jgi:cell division protein FtsZ
MLLEPVNRGRFEKSEPTIVDGQDLDVPAFMRMNVRIR